MLNLSLSQKLKYSNNHFLIWCHFVRPINGVCAAYGVFAVAILTAFAYNEPLIFWKFVLAVVVTFTTICGIIAHNDYYDLPSDRIVHSWRPLVRGTIKPKTGLYFICTLYTISIILSWFLGIIAFVIVAFNILNGWFYNAYSKRRWHGVITVSLSVGTIVPFGCVTVLPYNPFALLPLWIALTLSEIMREIGVTTQDTLGDSKSGFKTLPVTVGRLRALKLSSIPLLVATPLFLSHHFGWWNAVRIDNGMYLVGGAGYIVLLFVALINSYVHVKYCRNEKHTIKIIELNYRFIGRFYILLFQSLMILETTSFLFS